MELGVLAFRENMLEKERGKSKKRKVGGRKKRKIMRKALDFFLDNCNMLADLVLLGKTLLLGVPPFFLSSFPSFCFFLFSFSFCFFLG
jgi:hypothetical protein